MKSMLPLYIFLQYILINLVISYDFIVLEPQQSYNNLEKNITVKIYYELDDIDDLIDSLGSPKYETGRGFLVIMQTSVIRILNGLAKGGYSVVGYARDGNSYDRWTLQRIEKES